MGAFFYSNYSFCVFEVKEIRTLSAWRRKGAVMSEEKDAQKEQETAEKQEEETAKETETQETETKEQESAEKTFSQSEVDKMLGSVRIKVRKQYEDRLSNYDDLVKFKEEATPRLEKLQEFEAKEAQRVMKDEVVKESGLDYETVSLLAGDTKEELLANAEKHKKRYGVPAEPYGNSHHVPSEQRSSKKEFKKFMDENFD